MSRREALSRRCSAHGAGVVLSLGVLALVVGCTEEVQLGQSQVTSAGGADAVGGAAAAAPSSASAAGGTAPASFPLPLALDAGECVPVACGPRVVSCGDCVDNDADGRVDAADPECLGPCDDSEAELFTGLAARLNSSCRADCYFDDNSGYDDGCRWSYACDVEGVAPDFPPTGQEKCGYDPSLDCEAQLNGQSESCRSSCLPLTPNGCDCFGCCELPANSGQYVWLGSENLDAAHCELGGGADPSVCKPCTPVPSCQNECDECELCVGKTSLPASCATGDDGVLRASCPLGWRPCDPGSGLGCGRLEYCITGCCVPLPR